MPRLRIIVLDRPNRADPNTYRYLLWADVPAARQPFYAQPGRVSAWKDAQAADNTALAAGQVTEQEATIQVPSGATLAQIKAFLELRQATFQNDVTTNNPWIRYGTTFNGSAWVDGGVA